MSIPVHRASQPTQTPTMNPLPPQRPVPARRGLPVQLPPQFLMPQSGGQRSQASSGLVGSQDFFAAATHVDLEEEISRTMNSGSYFSNLMSDGLSYPAAYAAGQHDDSPLPDQVPGQEDTPAVAKEKRSKNFSVDEDKLLVSAWLNMTLDSIQRVDQSRNTYWKRIHDYFHTNKKFESDRSQCSLMNRWSGIQHDVNLFAGCLSKIEYIRNFFPY